jgi:hypothetical protein
VTNGERIERLQSLLERVRLRAAEPRRRSEGLPGEPPAWDVARVVATAAVPAVASAPVRTVVPIEPPAAPPTAPPIEPPEMLAAGPAAAEWTHGASAGGDAVTGVHRERAPVASYATADAEIGQEDAPSSEDHDSRERLVAAQPLAPEAATVEAAPRIHESAPPIEVGELEVPAHELLPGELEGDEEPPVSSRRPVASEPEERLARMAFGAEEPPQPIHTPPPESGRLPAAPAAEFEPDVDVTSVRNATPILPRRGVEPILQELVPEVIAPQLAASEAVADIVAEAQRFAPATFVELLDASLAM